MQNIKKLVEKHERLFSAGALFLGFIVDTLTLNRVDLIFDNAVLFTYLFIATGSIILINRYPLSKHSNWLPYLMQYAFGGLFSGYIIFYTQSASLAEGWFFVLFLIILFLGNERFKKRYQRTTFQLSILFVAIFSFSIFFIPVVIGKLGTFIFIISGIVSLVVIRFVIRLLQFASKEFRARRGSGLGFSIVTIYLIFNLLYFTNIIPPIPLSLKQLDVYHDVSRDNAGNFIGLLEKRPWYDFWGGTEVHWVSGNPIYVYSSVFAPTRLSAKISHQWLYFDEQTAEWEPISRIGFAISGGRDGGYRGYTFKYGLWEGVWRVEVKTDNNKIVGRTTFKIIETTTPPELEQEIN